MKKLISILAAALAALLVCVPAYAAETIDEVPGNTEISVYAKYVDNTDFTVISTDDNGSGSITLPDGTEITVDGADKANGRLIVEEVTDKEALDCAAKLLGNRTTDFRLFYIYWLDENGKTYPVSGVTVTIKLTENTAYTVYALNGDRSNKPDAKAKNGTVTFATDGSSFYALCKEAKTTVPDGKTPQTGDNSNLALWFALLLASGGAGILAAVYGRKKSRREI